MRTLSTRYTVAVALALAPLGLPAGSYAATTGQQGGTITSSIDVQLTVKPVCTNVSVSGNQVHFSAVPSTQPAVSTFQVIYSCAANAVPTLAFLSKNGCYLVPDNSTNANNNVKYQIVGRAGTNQLACSPAELQSRMQPVCSSPATFTVKTAPLLNIDPHVSPLGTYGDTVIATLDF